MIERTLTHIIDTINIGPTEKMLALAILHYTLALIFYTISVSGPRWRWGHMGRAVMLVGLGFNVAGFILRWRASHHVPFSGMYETMMFFPLGVAAVTAVFELIHRARALAIASMAICITMLAVGLFKFQADPKPLMAALQSAWLEIHVSSYFLGYAALGVAFGAGIISLIQVIILAVRGLKTDGPADAGGMTDYSNVAHKAVALGFPFLTIGLVTGCVWAQFSWGRYWGWDPKETWALISWIIYLIYLHLPWILRSIKPGLSSRGLAFRTTRTVALFVGFAFVLMTWIGVNYLPSARGSLHSYGAGENQTEDESDHEGHDHPPGEHQD